MNYNIVAIPGDGIGPEIVREAKKVLDKVGEVYGHKFNYTDILNCKGDYNADGQYFNGRLLH